MERESSLWTAYRGTLLIRYSLSPLGPPQGPGIVLMLGPGGALFLVSKVPLCCSDFFDEDIL